MGKSESFQKETMNYQGDTPVRLDVFLHQKFQNTKNVSRSYWTNMIHAGYVKVNDAVVKAGSKLKPGCTISIEWPLITDEFSDKISIIFDDEDILVINKPAGMLVHSKGAFNPEFTVADFLKKNTNGGKEASNNRDGVVHRLDRYTSGVMVLAKNQSALKQLQAQFEKRTTQKWYIAIVEGLIAEPKQVDIPLARDKKNPKRFCPAPEGKRAITDIIPLYYDEALKQTTVILRPHTGRTHQLRVHLSHIKRPIVGDSLYGAVKRADFPRFLLHAYYLGIDLPSTAKYKSFIAPLPDDMSSYVNNEQAATISKIIESKAKKTTS